MVQACSSVSQFQGWTWRDVIGLSGECVEGACANGLAGMELQLPN